MDAPENPEDCPASDLFEPEASDVDDYELAERLGGGGSFVPENEAEGLPESEVVEGQPASLEREVSDAKPSQPLAEEAMATSEAVVVAASQDNVLMESAERLEEAQPVPVTIIGDSPPKAKKNNWDSMDLVKRERIEFLRLDKGNFCIHVE